ncbi:cupin domain-containing protein [Halopenitus persicus]|uniref:cupin domain-containing protein n=1 Tax=Halopenitus persicus TaxID=1048396 RepID=UPI000BBA9C0C|nr:cupin domain-containing protein [Halopenitus persicus]
METIDVADLDAADSPQNRASVADALGADDFAMNYYALDPGEAFTAGLHAHLDQEETFLVLEGEATFETAPGPTADSETVTVGEGQLVRFEPGEYQQGRNESDAPLRALAMGTPQESTDVRIAGPCEACGDSDYLAFAMIDGAPGVECPECGMQAAL